MEMMSKWLGGLQLELYPLILCQEWLQKIDFRSARYLRRLGENPLLMTCSAIAKLAPRLSGWTAIKQILGKMRHVVAEHVDRHRKEFRPDENPRDFIDAYLKRIESTTDSSSSFYKDAGSKRQLNKRCQFSTNGFSSPFKLNFHSSPVPDGFRVRYVPSGGGHDVSYAIMAYAPSRQIPGRSK